MWSHVVHRNSHSMLSTSSDKVMQIIGWTLVCVSIHLECWLNKPRVEIATWASVGVAYANSKSVTIQFQIFGSVNVINVDSIRIRCASSECEFNFAFKQD